MTQVRLTVAGQDARALPVSLCRHTLSSSEQEILASNWISRCTWVTRAERRWTKTRHDRLILFGINSITPAG